MSNKILTWKITPTEKRKRVRKLILKIWFPFLIFVIFSSFYYQGEIFYNGIKSAFNTILFIIITIITIMLLFFLLNKFWIYKERNYQLDSAGIKISKGKNKKTFFWNEFESFYPFRNYQKYHPKESTMATKQESIRQKLFEAGENIEGQVFYLKKKSAGLFSKYHKTFVVVYSEPNNQKSVMKFLNKKLPRKKMTATTDLGLVSYIFR